MTVLDIIYSPNPILNQVCDPITDFGDMFQTLIDDMRDTMKANQGIGLAAPQVGVLDRVFICEYEKEFYVCANPVITLGNQEVESEEGCLSLPGLLAVVDRTDDITIEAKDRYGVPFKKTFKGMMAIIMQHENDHLNGVLITDKALSINKVEDNL